MRQYLIEIDSPEDEALLLSILPRLNGRVVEKKESVAPAKPSLFEVLEGLSQSGAAAAFGDPLAWQREVRKDRILPGREE